MAERLTPLPAGFDPRSRLDLHFSVEKLAFFCNPAFGGMSQALQLHCEKIAVAKAKMVPHLEAWVQRT
jgi:hypothetical protein